MAFESSETKTVAVCSSELSEVKSTLRLSTCPVVVDVTLSDSSTCHPHFVLQAIHIGCRSDSASTPSSLIGVAYTLPHRLSCLPQDA